MARRIVPDLVRDQLLTILTPDTSVLDAARIMAERNIGAVMIGENGVLAGIFTERDMTFRIVASNCDPARTSLGEVMTADPITIGPNEAPHRALDLMRNHGCRHLPVVENGRIAGMVSIRDLYAALHDDLAEDLRHRDEFIMGSGYSLQ